jgi:hypothetical protein
MEYKLSVKNEEGVQTTYVKRVIDQGFIATELSTLAARDGIEFFTLRKVVEKPLVKKLLKETK